MGNPTNGKVTMGAAVEWFKKEKLHWQTIAQFTVAVLEVILYTSLNIPALWPRLEPALEGDIGVFPAHGSWLE
jgi:hypothetical protein